MSVISIVAHKPHPRKSINWQRYDELKAQGESDTAIAPLLGMSQPGLSHRKKTRHLDELTPPSTSEPSSEPGQPRGLPTHKRGFVMADDLFEAIHTYAQGHHLQVKTVLDSALRECFARRGWPGEEGRPEA
jgi:hypothetical protein